MTSQRELDSLLGAFLAEGPEQVADRVVDSALDQVNLTKQRRFLELPWRLTQINALSRLAAAAVIGVLVVGAGIYLARPNPAPIAASPSPGPSASPSQPAVVVFSPTAAEPTPLPSGAARPAQAGQFDDACDFGLGSATVGWISTTTALYRTQDLGQTWSAVQPAGWSSATAVANLFIDADTAYSFLQGSPSKIAATHDGGATWVETALGDSTAWPAFSFQTPLSGSLIFYGQLKTDPVSIYATADGGLTWAEPQSATTVWAAIMPDWCTHREPNATLQQTHPWLDRNPLDGLVQLSRDAGLTWQTRPIPAGDDPVLWGDGSGGIVLAVHSQGGPPVNDQIYTSNDDGQSWQLAADLTGGGRNAQFLSATEWFLIAGDGSSIASTVDGGANWRTVLGSLTFMIGPTSFASPDVGWAAPNCGPWVNWAEPPPTHPACDPTGVKRLILQTTDGGRTWTAIAGSGE
jgi:photosystem II stability/assembly factor-like uncharacterized protein